MTQLLLKKEYKELLGEKEQAEKELRWFLVKKLWVTKHFDELKGIARLKLHGGPKNLSSKLDNYLYA
ncbi:hypothetical protein A3B19_02050 [Candidatus Giovannonibacteria bacterium RIFCSPLOWO2_01_FULL_46_32]|uniref:Uncharacterized protein n=1 Tax=Candidatus Giovannonibacteria bacterium RIFCSPLOWO2_01_FULL_46_32 TaxID=1798353 RepID=A0A1F5XIE5_9BACT|nr:MAG: hypothetical protein A3B19_02050 [Candidatus Giovannonibacteria bacterium RIFCSPLOWO2_01_FULL_46_32]